MRNSDCERERRRKINSERDRAKERFQIREILRTRDCESERLLGL